VLPQDPAIDDEQGDPEKYAELGFRYKDAVDAGAVVLKNGVKPTLFKIMPIESKQRRIVASFDNDTSSVIERADFLIRAGLLEINPWQVQADDGTTREESFKLERKDYGRHGTCCKLEEVEKLPLKIEHIITLANMIWKISETDPTGPQPSEPPSGPTKP
jgi:hypothetical protein